jgi:hypothetical protein
MVMRLDHAVAGNVPFLELRFAFLEIAPRTEIFEKWLSTSGIVRLPEL